MRSVGFGVGLYRLRVARGESAQRVLNAVAELARDILGNVDGVLRHEIDADALRADQAHDLLDLFSERGRRIVEQQMRLVEEEDELRLVGVADFGKRLEHLRQQPEQRSEEHTSELQSLMRISYAVFCLKKKKKESTTRKENTPTTKTTAQTNSVRITDR